MTAAEFKQLLTRMGKQPHRAGLDQRFFGIVEEALEAGHSGNEGPYNRVGATPYRREMVQPVPFRILIFVPQRCP